MTTDLTTGFDPSWEEPLDELDRQAAAEADHEPAPTRPPARRGHLEAVPDRPGTTIPHSLEAEEALIASAILSATACDTLATVDPGDFYQPAHQHIADAIQTIHAEGHPVNEVTIANHLRGRDLLDAIGGAGTLIKLHTPASTAAPRFAAIVRDHATRRRLQLVGEDIKHLAADQTRDPAATAGAAQALLDKIHDRNATSGGHLAIIGDELDAYIELLAQRDGQTLTGIPTGLDALDKVIGGLQDSRLYCIAGRPAMGKSDVGASLARSAATAGHTTLVVSVEMARRELLDRWLASTARVSSTHITNGTLTPKDWERVSPALLHLADLPLWIDDNPGASIATIRADLRRSGASIVIVDYMQLIETPKGENRQVEVTEISKGLRRIARDFEIPVIALAQLNRGVEGRLDKRPMLSDLRESGSIEQDCDVVLGLYRDGYYHPDSTDKDLMELIPMKNRTGPTTTVKAYYNPELKILGNLGND